jgi:hypothetical protein
LRNRAVASTAIVARQRQRAQSVNRLLTITPASWALGSAADAGRFCWQLDLRKRGDAMLRFIRWEIGLFINGMLLRCYELVASPLMRNSPGFDQQMDERWERLSEEADDFFRQAEQLHAELQNRWDLRDWPFQLRSPFTR